MIEIKMPKDIRGYSEKLFLGLSLRQLIATIGTCLVATGIYFLCKGTPLEDWLFIIIVIPVSPLAVWGFLRPQGLNAEQYLGNILQSVVLWPEKRYYATENFYEDVVHEIQLEKEAAILAIKNAQKKKKSKK